MRRVFARSLNIDEAGSPGQHAGVVFPISVASLAIAYLSTTAEHAGVLTPSRRARRIALTDITPRQQSPNIPHGNNLGTRATVVGVLSRGRVISA